MLFHNYSRMKHLHIVFALLLSAVAVKAQTGLQFSQALLPSGTLPITTGSTVNLGTVPPGKVWKFEHSLNSYGSCVSFSVNGGPNIPLPSDAMWFPAGTQLSIVRSCSVSTVSNIVFSLLEFTIVP